MANENSLPMAFSEQHYIMFCFRDDTYLAIVSKTNLGELRNSANTIGAQTDGELSFFVAKFENGAIRIVEIVNHSGRDDMPYIEIVHKSLNVLRNQTLEDFVSLFCVRSPERIPEACETIRTEDDLLMGNEDGLNIHALLARIDQVSE